MYIGWNARAELVTTKLIWYDADKLVDVLQELRKYLFDKPAEQFPNYFIQCHTLGHEFSVSRYERFPEGRRFVSQGVGSWCCHWDYILLYISVLVDTRKIDRRYRTHKTIGELELNIVDAVNETLELVKAESSIFNQQRFEERYNLIWVDNKEAGKKRPFEKITKDGPPRKYPRNSGGSTTPSGSCSGASVSIQVNSKQSPPRPSKLDNGKARDLNIHPEPRFSDKIVNERLQGDNEQHHSSTSQGYAESVSSSGSSQYTTASSDLAIEQLLSYMQRIGNDSSSKQPKYLRHRHRRQTQIQGSSSGSSEQPKSTNLESATNSQPRGENSGTSKDEVPLYDPIKVVEQLKEKNTILTNLAEKFKMFHSVVSCITKIRESNEFDSKEASNVPTRQRGPDVSSANQEAPIAEGDCTRLPRHNPNSSGSHHPRSSSQSSNGVLSIPVASTSSESSQQDKSGSGQTSSVQNANGKSSSSFWKYTSDDHMARPVKANKFSARVIDRLPIINLYGEGRVYQLTGALLLTILYLFF
ncbi:hypothetical protein BJV82DRAFT_573238 [Fennellomyces sp. T-0311]|nr:hypothetical protein BJV82DRAFT_573238 [Fennellomyces sp. T-0311]